VATNPDPDKLVEEALDRASDAGLRLPGALTTTKTFNGVLGGLLRDFYAAAYAAGRAQGMEEAVAAVGREATVWADEPGQKGRGRRAAFDLAILAIQHASAIRRAKEAGRG
jgi:hypothetical protein